MDRRDLLIGTIVSSATFALPALAEEPSRFWLGEWPNTDFSRSSAPFREIISGGVPRDGIPALREVVMIGAASVNDIDPREPVVTLEIEGQRARAYPVRYLTWHEIANDTVDGVPVAVTYCPLCNSALVFDRRVNGRVLDFGVSGKLRFSDMVMFDRQTESWWQQFTGRGIVGEMTDVQLEILPAWMESLGEYKARNPGGLIMAEPTGYRRPYGRNPYRGYDTAGWPFLYNGEAPPHGLDPMSRVVRVGNHAWPLSRFSGTPEITEQGVRIVWQGGMASPLDTSTIGKGRDIGSIRVFDAETGAPVAHEVIFAFVFHAFEPEGNWHLGS
ncbi:MAG: DUF3179 domain-containing protein [Paracoccaceae bacterium]